MAPISLRKAVRQVLISRGSDQGTLIIIALNTPKTDIKPADEIGLAAAQISILLWNSTKEDKYLFRAVLCLRQLVEDSPSNAYAKVLLINVYRILGDFFLYDVC